MSGEVVEQIREPSTRIFLQALTGYILITAHDYSTHSSSKKLVLQQMVTIIYNLTFIQMSFLVLFLNGGLISLAGHSLYAECPVLDCGTNGTNVSQTGT